MSKPQFDLSEQIFNTIFEQSPISTQIFSPTGETLRVNKAWQKLWGVTLDQLGNYNILRDKQLINTEVFKYIEEGFSGKIVKVPPHKYIPTKTVKESTAPVRWVQNYIYPIKDTDGKVVHIVMQHEDITENKLVEEKLAENENRFRTLIETNTDAIAIVAMDGTFTYISPTVKKILGYTPKELLGTSTNDLFPKEELKRLEKTFAEVVKTPGKTITVEHRTIHKNGSIVWLESTITNRNNTPTIHGFVSNFHDITNRKKAEEDQARLAAIVESSNDAIISKSLEGIITSWNKAAQEMYGYTAKEAVGQHIYLIVPKELRREEDTILAKLKRGEYIDHFETTRVRKDGKRIAVSLTISPVRDTSGTIIGTSKIARDITEIKIARERQQFLETLTAALTQSLDEHITLAEIAKHIVPFLADYCRIAIIDDHKNIHEINVNHKNPKRIQLTNELYESYTHDASTVLGVPHILRTGKAEILSEVTDEVFEQYHTNEKTRYIVKAIGLTSYMGVPLIARNKIIGAITFSSTSKERLYTKRDLRFVQELAGRVALLLDNVRLYKEATEEIERRKKLEQVKNEFISVASHELKTPVTSIKVYAQVLHKRFLQGGDTKSAEHLAKMDAQLTKLTNLIVDLLDISKIESGKLQFSSEKFWFDDLVHEIVEEMQRITNRHNIKLQGKAHTQLYADRERIGQVMINFISNAVKYSPEADSIVVYMKVKNAHVEFCVEDFGVGIPLEKQDKVFERFYRVSGPKEDTFPGLGLGLYISSEIIKRQDGKIWLESEEGKGSRFCFSIPITRNHPNITNKSE